MPRLTNVIHNVAEQVGDATRSLWPWSWAGTTGIRNYVQWQGGLRFWPTTDGGTLTRTEVNYGVTRALYRNEGENPYGGGFAKPVVDLQVGFMGIPMASSENDTLNTFLNECLRDYWAEEIQQMFRDAIRDSKCIVRITKPDILDPLMTLEESRHCKLELLPPERVDIERSATNKNIIERALIRHRMVFITDDGSPSEGIDPTVEEHDVIEIIDRQRFRFFDQTTNAWIDSMGRNNPWNFVPLLEVLNEWDASLQGGQSDLETVIPFINAFNDVLVQGLQAHKYHSTPKIKMKVSDVAAFIKANFPSAWDDTTQTINGTINWSGNEILFMQDQDDAGFIEARSVLGDSRMLLEFLIDCICIASQTPEWAFMRVDSGSANSDRNAQTVPFVKKISRKRNNFARPVQELLKMVQVINDLIPYRPPISWETVRPDDEMIEMQAFQQLVMGLEVARERNEISDETYRRMIKQFLPSMKGSTQEARDAERNAPSLAALPVVAGPQGRNE